MFRIWGAVVLLLITASGRVLGQTPHPAIEDARSLYYAAAYEQALEVLDRVQAANTSERVGVELFRGASLFALDRSSEAERAFERLVRLNPDVLPDQLGMTPWITSRFAAVRARVLGEMERQKLDERDRQGAREVQSDIDFYTLADTSVSPPAPIREHVPEPPVIKGADYSRTITLFVDISTDGSVERVRLEGTIHPRIDALIRRAASAWLYRPATLNGRAVKFRKALKIEIR